MQRVWALPLVGLVPQRESFVFPHQSTLQRISDHERVLAGVNAFSKETSISTGILKAEWEKGPKDRGSVLPLGPLACFPAPHLGRSHCWWPPGPQTRTNPREARLRQAQACKDPGCQELSQGLSGVTHRGWRRRPGMLKGSQGLGRQKQGKPRWLLGSWDHGIRG